MDNKGWMPYFLMIIVLVMFCTVVIILFSATNIFGKLDFSVVSEQEQSSVVPFIIAYNLLNSDFGEKAFFQQASYLAAGEKLTPDKEAVLNSYASTSANNYMLSLYNRRLTSGGLLENDKVSAAVIPVFTFEKKKESLEIKASG